MTEPRQVVQRSHLLSFAQLQQTNGKSCSLAFPLVCVLLGCFLKFCTLFHENFEQSKSLYLKLDYKSTTSSGISFYEELPEAGEESRREFLKFWTKTCNNRS